MHKKNRRDCQLCLFLSLRVFRQYKIFVRLARPHTHSSARYGIVCWMDFCRSVTKFKAFSVLAIDHIIKQNNVNYRLSSLSLPVALSHNEHKMTNLSSKRVLLSYVVYSVVWVVPSSVVFIFGWRRFVFWHRHTLNTLHLSAVLKTKFDWRNGSYCCFLFFVEQLNDVPNWIGQINHKSLYSRTRTSLAQNVIAFACSAKFTHEILWRMAKRERQPHLHHELSALTFKC